MLILACRNCNKLFIGELSQPCPFCGKSRIQEGQALVDGLLTSYDELLLTHNEMMKKYFDLQIEYSSKSKFRL